ncbi:MAG: class I SAM-dependent methyltransferase [Pseudomonadota bacterium]
MSNPKNLTELYSGVELDTLFKGNFINFGYWKKIPHNLTEKDAVEANANLYHQVFKHLMPEKEDKILEVGSGYGAGCALLASLHSTQSIIGLDYLTAHVKRSSKAHSSLIEEKKVQYLQGKAEAIPLPNASINKIYTVEAFQHFNAQYAIPEFARVLIQGSKLVISTFFAKNKNCFKELLTLLPRPAILPDDSNEDLAALPEVLNLLKNNLFKNIQIENIGQYVWSGYDIWVRQNEPGIWDTNWRTAYERELLDYYIITANF